MASFPSDAVETTLKSNHSNVFFKSIAVIASSSTIKILAAITYHNFFVNNRIYIYLINFYLIFIKYLVKKFATPNYNT